jgi:RNA polymerase sigma-70 factor (ECF subfamily)
VLLLKSQLAFAMEDGDADWVSGLRSFADLRQKSSSQGQKIVELYDALRPALIAYLVSLGLVREEAEDIIQESFLRLIDRLKKDAGESLLRPWLFRVAHNLAVDQFRSATYRSSVSAIDVDTVGDTLIDGNQTPEESVIERQRWVHAQHLIALLTPQQKYAVLLRSEGLRYREIAEVLGISTKRAAELVQRAMVRLAGEP